MSAMDQIREREEREKEEVLGLLREQLKVEGQLIALYNETVPTIGNRPVRHLVDMIALDSRKHVSICQAAIDILEGEEVLSDDKPPLHEGIERHLELEEGSTERANKILGNVWIRENQALSEMVNKLRDDERRHIETLRKLSQKAFFRFDPRDFTVVMRGLGFAEERYRRTRKFREKKGKE